MGCCYSNRCTLTTEEACCYNMDLILGYYKNYCHIVYKIHKEHSLNEKISNENFKIIENQLNLFKIQTDSLQLILNFYSIFRADIDSFDSKKLTIFAVIQSKGSLQDKSSILFEIISAGNQAITKAELNKFFCFIFDVFIYMTGKLKVKDHLNEISSDDLEKFSMKLRIGKEKALETLNKIYFQENNDIDLLQFTQDTFKNLNSDIFTGHGIRSYLKANSISESKI